MKNPHPTDTDATASLVESALAMGIEIDRDEAERWIARRQEGS